MSNLIQDSIGKSVGSGGLEELSEDPGYIKLSIMGWQGSGKTFNGLLLACGLHKMLGNKSPIKVFDSEKGVSYQRTRVKALTGMNPIGIEAQNFQDLMRFTTFCKEGDIVFIDSVTQPWQELFRAAIKAKGDGFPAIQLAKDEWSPFTKWLVGSPCHIFVCGRAGNEYDSQVNEVSGKREIVKIGSKMKAEGEFAYEPALNLEAYRCERPDGVLEHKLLVKKDKFSLIDGRSFTFLPSRRIQEDLTYNPVFEKFESWFRRFNIKPGGVEVGLDVEDKTLSTLNTQGDGEFRRKMLLRNSLMEQIKNKLESTFLGQGAKERAARRDVIEELLGTTSWEAIKGNLNGKFPVEILSECKEKLFAQYPSKPMETPKGGQAITLEEEPATVGKDKS